MDYSLVLTHLHSHHAHHKALHVLRDRPTPPENSNEVIEHLEQTGLTGKEALDLFESARRRTDATLENLEKNSNIGFIGYWSDRYPRKLRWIKEPPWGIFYTGHFPKKDSTLAIVGSRRPDRYGARVLAEILPALQKRPLQIISGLAYGIDALAHFHACELGIPNFAVMGCGINEIYPREHYDLAKRIENGSGGILSEFPPGEPAYKQNFPRRNRIISALSDVVWVVQATRKSGTKHTIDYALEQNKEVATTPGELFNELSAIPNRLLADGAWPIIEAADLNRLLETTGSGEAGH